MYPQISLRKHSAPCCLKPILPFISHLNQLESSHIIIAFQLALSESLHPYHQAKEKTSYLLWNCSLTQICPFSKSVPLFALISYRHKTDTFTFSKHKKAHWRIQNTGGRPLSKASVFFHLLTAISAPTWNRFNQPSQGQPRCPGGISTLFGPHFTGLRSQSVKCFSLYYPLHFTKGSHHYNSFPEAQIHLEKDAVLLCGAEHWNWDRDGLGLAGWNHLTAVRPLNGMGWTLCVTITWNLDLV